MSLETNNYPNNSDMPLPPSMQKKTEKETIPIIKSFTNNKTLFSDETRVKLERLRQHHFHPTNIPDSPDFGTNQYMNINEELKQQLKDVVSQFNAPVRYAVAYGSGVFRQSGYDEKVQKRMHYYLLNHKVSPLGFSIEKAHGRFHIRCQSSRSLA
jgi:translocator assembly and maintenance protein 41